MSKVNKKVAKNFKQDRIYKFYDDGSVHVLPVFNIDSGYIETHEDFLPEEDAKKFYNRVTGGWAFVYQLDMPAKVESSKLKNLYRSAVIKNLFNYESSNSPDLMKLLLFGALALAVIF